MSVKYADIIIDISQTNVDRPFRYRIPDLSDIEYPMNCWEI